VPVSLAFHFPAGRYHATPYGHHVNEGLIEWPPSPWRILRALISVGYTSGIWNCSGPPPDARRLMEKLAAEPPQYWLPPALGTHSRHYMPTGVLNSKTKLEKTTLVFDTWARIESQKLLVFWNDIHLDHFERSCLEILVERLNYLGRSESWVEGRVMGEDEAKPESNCFPENTGQAPSSGWEQVALLAPTSATDFIAWRDQKVGMALADLQPPNGRKPSKALLRKRDKAMQLFPVDLLDCLQKDTTWLRSHGWSQPPGSRRIFYWRPSHAISVGAPKMRRNAPPARRIEAFLLSITNASGNDHALPSVTRTLPQAELLHRALVGVAARRDAPPPEITGCDEHRRPLGGPHQHAHINPLDLNGDGHLDHILIWAPMGLGAAAQSAVRATRKTFKKGGIEPLRLAVAATGDLNDLSGLQGEYGKGMIRISGYSSSWQSITPFVPPRHLKMRGRNTLEGQVRSELKSRNLPDPVAVHEVPLAIHNQRNSPQAATMAMDGRRDGISMNRLRHFKLIRTRGPQPPATFGFAIQLKFEEPIKGPIALGYGSHFGLGLFGHVSK